MVQWLDSPVSLLGEENVYRHDPSDIASPLLEHPAANSNAAAIVRMI